VVVSEAEAYSTFNSPVLVAFRFHPGNRECESILGVEDEAQRMEKNSTLEWAFTFTNTERGVGGSRGWSLKGKKERKKKFDLHAK